MHKTIAMVGKGGTGKTTLSALIIRYLVQNGHKPVLAVDADSNATLNLALGVQVDQTVGGMREDMTENIKQGDIPSGMSKDTYIEYQLQQTLVEAEGFDLLVMGRPEGPGCYCFANNLLRRHIDGLAKNYSYLVMDNEAGMEHLSRRTTQQVDQMFIVSEPTPVGILTAGRIKALSQELKLGVSDTRLVVNRAGSQVPQTVWDAVQEQDLDPPIVLPMDELILEYTNQGRSLLEVPQDSPAVQEVEKLCQNWVLRE